MNRRVAILCIVCALVGLALAYFFLVPGKYGMTSEGIDAPLFD